MYDIFTEDLLEQAVKIACEKDYVNEVSGISKDVHTFSEEFEVKMKELIAPSKVQKAKRKLKKRHYLLVAILVVFMIAGTTALAVDEIREQIFEYFESLFSDHTDVYFESKEDEIKTTLPREEIMKPEYIPEGFRMEEEIYDEEFGTYDLIYSNEEGIVLAYSQMVLDEINRTSYTSKGDKAKRIMLDSDQAYIISDDKSVKTILYEKNGYVLSIGGLLSEEELIKMLESVNTKK